MTRPSLAVYNTKPTSRLCSQGVFSSMRSIVQSEGFPGLFRGLVPTMATIGPFAALFLTFYTQVGHSILPFHRTLSLALELTVIQSRDC